MGALPEGWALPELTAANRTWFTSGEVAIQCCSHCGVLQHPPEEICHRCGSMDLGTRTLAPRGTIHSHTVVHYAANRQLADAVPFLQRARQSEKHRPMAEGYLQVIAAVQRSRIAL